MIDFVKKINRKKNFDLQNFLKFFSTFNFRFSVNSGFTLIETMVAISILLIALTGPLVMAKQGLMSSRLVKNQIIAFYLAQDALEYIRSVKYSNLLSGSGWLNGLGNCIGGFCEVDATTDSISSCGASCPLLKKSNNGLYGYTAGWTDTGFRRKVRIYSTNLNSDESYLEVEVLWDNGSKNFIIRESLFNLN